MANISNDSLVGYDLHFMSVDTADDMVNEGRNLVIVALVGTNLHIRIFNANRKRVVDVSDKAENELISGETPMTLKQKLSSLLNKSGLSQEKKQKIIQYTTLIVGYTPSIQRVERLKEIQPDSFELWKYYEERADNLGKDLWSIGSWFMTVITATLSLPFLANLIKSENGFPYLKIETPIPIWPISIFGMLFCIYSYSALRDLKEHIESNWQKAGYILEGTWQEANWGGRKSHGWNILLVVGILAMVAFVGLLLLTLFQADNGLTLHPSRPLSAALQT